MPLWLSPVTRAGAELRGDAAALWSIARDWRGADQTVRLLWVLIAQGGVTVNTPVTPIGSEPAATPTGSFRPSLSKSDEPLLATVIQLDGDILTMVNPALFSLDPASWPEWGERHVQAVRDRMASIQGLPDALRAIHGGLFAGFTLINGPVLAWTAGPALQVALSWPELIAPLVQLAMQCALPFARQCLRRSCGWIAGRVVRWRLRPLTAAWHAEGPVVKARIEEERIRRRIAPGASES